MLDMMERPMATKQPRTWILVADSARARAVAWTGRNAPLEAIEGIDLHYRHQLSRDMMSERPGRVHESSGTTRHAIEPRTDPSRQAERNFALSVAQALEDGFGKSEFDRLVLVAGPTMLGDLRAALSPKVQAAIQGELIKDLTHLTNTELKQHLVEAAIL
jgi:protein required for attachment to host cells